MRTKASSALYFDFSGESMVKIVKEYRVKYQAISDLLDANPRILALAHQDWSRLLSTSAKGRDGYTSEQLLRALIVMFMEGQDYRGTVVQIENSEFFRNFVRLGVKPAMAFTFLNKAYGILVLKRAFKLGKCFFKGFKRYAAGVGLAVLCHNLVLPTRL